MCYLNEICFVCLSDKEKLNAVFHKETDNEIFIQVKFALPELAILDSEVSMHICSLCRTTLCAFYKFKKNCLENYSRLKHYILKTLQVTDDTQEDQNVRELQISEINCDQPLKQKQQQDFELKIEDENEDSFSETEEQIFSAFEMKMDDNKQLIKPEPEEDIVSNVKYGNEYTFLSSEEQNVQKTVVEASIDLKEESLASEDNADRDINELLMNRGPVSDDDRDSVLSHTSNHALDTDDVNSNSDAEIQEFQCSMCTQMFSDKSIFDTHMRYHINNVTGLECLICNKQFSKKCRLYRHMKSEFGIRDYECSICKKKFSQSGNMKTHMKSHLRKKDNQCTICKKKFLQVNHLKLHMKSHFCIQTYECFICKKTFSQGDHLNRHIYYHLPWY